MSLQAAKPSDISGFSTAKKIWKLRKKISRSIERSWRVCTKRFLSEGIADLPFGTATRITILQRPSRKNA